MTPEELQTELDKLSAWTADGAYIRARSTYETDTWNALVQLGLVERTVLSNLNQYRIKR